MQLTKEHLMTLTVKQLASIDIKNSEEEALVQEVINSKAVITKPAVKFDYKKVPDIKTPEDEKKWQDTINAFNASQAPVEAKITAATEKLESLDVEIKNVEQKTDDTVKTETVPDVDASFKCDCGREFKTENSLKIHRTRSHKNQ